MVMAGRGDPLGLTTGDPCLVHVIRGRARPIALSPSEMFRAAVEFPRPPARLDARDLGTNNAPVVRQAHIPTKGTFMG
jgi:hypothetical protein